MTNVDACELDRTARSRSTRTAPANVATPRRSVGAEIVARLDRLRLRRREAAATRRTTRRTRSRSTGDRSSRARSACATATRGTSSSARRGSTGPAARTSCRSSRSWPQTQATRSTPSTDQFGLADVRARPRARRSSTLRRDAQYGTYHVVNDGTMLVRGVLRDRASSCSVADVEVEHVKLDDLGPSGAAPARHEPRRARRGRRPVRAAPRTGGTPQSVPGGSEPPKLTAYAGRLCVIGVEATSLIGPRSGVGHTTASIVEALVDAGRRRRDHALPDQSPPRRLGASFDACRAHPRMQVARVPGCPDASPPQVWSRVEWPPAELFCGPIDVFWGPNFLLPPLVKAAGVVTVHDLAFVDVPETCSDAVLRYNADRPAHGRSARTGSSSPSQIRRGRSSRSGCPTRRRGSASSIPGVRRAFRERGGPLTQPRREALGIREPYAAFVGNLELRKNVDVLVQGVRAGAHRPSGSAARRRRQPGRRLGRDQRATREAARLRTPSASSATCPTTRSAAIVRVRGVRLSVACTKGSVSRRSKRWPRGRRSSRRRRRRFPKRSANTHGGCIRTTSTASQSAIGDHFDGEPDEPTIEAARSGPRSSRGRSPQRRRSRCSTKRWRRSTSDANGSTFTPGAPACAFDRGATAAGHPGWDRDVRPRDAPPPPVRRASSSIRSSRIHRQSTLAQRRTAARATARACRAS